MSVDPANLSSTVREVAPWRTRKTRVGMIACCGNAVTLIIVQIRPAVT
jgi:negative regulator of sigma E activity